MSRTLRPAVLIVLSTLLVVVGGAVPAAAGGGGGCHADLQDAATTDVEAGKNCFLPAVARVDVGDTVTWTNLDPVPHTATGTGGIFDTREFLPRETATATFDEAGVYPYACLLHPGMVGAIVVGNGAGAVGTGADDDEAEVSAASAPTSAAASSSPATSYRPAAAVAGAILLAVAGAFVVRSRLGRRAGAETA